MARIIRWLQALALFVCVSGTATAQVAELAKPGASIDARGSAAIDPSENVKALSEAANKRQDDLRLATEQLIKAQAEALEKQSITRYDHMKELLAANILRFDDLSKLRSEYNERLSVAEAKRIDAIRAVDVNAVAVASTRATDQASVLATQVSQSAEALRALVATTAATVAASQQQLASTLSARLTTLEQAGYQQAGKQIIQDPAYAALLRQVEILSQARTAVTATGEGRSDVVGWAVAGLTLLIAFIGLVMVLVRRSPQTRR